MQLRPYQLRALNEISRDLAKNKKSLAYLSVSFGKTHLMAEIARRFKGTILITVPKISLIQQTYDKVKLVTDDVDIYCSSLRRKNLGAKVVISTIQSIRKVKHKFGIIIIDEAHLMAESILKTTENIEHDYILGLTGTPFLIDNIYGEGKFWNSPCCKLTMKELTKMGFLSPIVLQSSVHQADLKGVKVNAGEYALSEMLNRYRPIIEEQVQDALDKTADRKAVLWLAINIEHADLIHRMIPGSMITHSKIKTDIEPFKRGEVKHLVSVSQINVGFDAPIADALVIMRATKSPSLFVQSVGRVVRKCEGKKDGLILDYGRVLENIGHPYDIVDASNLGSDKMMKMCPSCEHMSRQEMKRCIHCGHEFKVLCEECLNSKPYGEPCNFCERKKVERDVYKNLTTEPNDGWLNVTEMKIAKHTSAAGNEGLKVIYFSGFRAVFTEYFNDKYPSSFLFKLFLNESLVDKSINAEGITTQVFLEEKMESQVATPRRLKLEKSGRYKKVVERRFFT